MKKKKTFKILFSYYCYIGKSFIWHTICKKKKKRNRVFGIPITHSVVKTTVGKENRKNYYFKKRCQKTNNQRLLCLLPFTVSGILSSVT